jgi:hypothetical protein
MILENSLLRINMRLERIEKCETSSVIKVIKWRMRGWKEETARLRKARND